MSPFETLNEFVLIILSFGSIAALFGALLAVIAQRSTSDSDDIITQINLLLPQTQCGQCGHPGCKPYATAISQGEAINRCPPGGQATVEALAKLLNTESLPLDTSLGTTPKTPMVAYIREDECIGCTKCIDACPVDAILGASKFMHTVITEECTGCDLCLPPCPVDCIDMVPAAPFTEQPKLAENTDLTEPPELTAPPELTKHNNKIPVCTL